MEETKFKWWCLRVILLGIPSRSLLQRSWSRCQRMHSPASSSSSTMLWKQMGTHAEGEHSASELWSLKTCSRSSTSSQCFLRLVSSVSSIRLCAAFLKDQLCRCCSQCTCLVARYARIRYGIHAYVPIAYPAT